MAAISQTRVQSVRMAVLGVILATASYYISEQWRHKTVHWYEALVWAMGYAIAAFGNRWIRQIWKKQQAAKAVS